MSRTGEVRRAWSQRRPPDPARMLGLEFVRLAAGNCRWTRGMTPVSDGRGHDLPPPRVCTSRTLAGARLIPRELRQANEFGVDAHRTIGGHRTGISAHQ